MPQRILYLESVAGIAGDMFTAAFLDAGLVDPDAIRAVPALLGSPEVTVEIQTVERSGARATHLRVVLPDGRTESQGHPHAHPDGGHGPAPHPHRHYPALVRQIQESKLGESAKDFALRVFRLLGEAEAHAHGVSLEEVTFHEVGAMDSVVDVAMAGVSAETLGNPRFLASPIKLGRGHIHIAHGTYPVPPPASARLARGMPVEAVPEAITRENVELSTPTGLAILRALEPGFTVGWPRGTLLAEGMGSGTLDLSGYPNVFRVALLEAPDDGQDMGIDSFESPAPEAVREFCGQGPTPSLPYLRDRVTEIHCNVDDQTGERTAWLMERALELGALDGWVTALLGKKGRPTQEMALLVKPEDRDRFVDFLLRHSTTLGVRFANWDRFKLVREEEIRKTAGGAVSYKIGKTTDGEILKEKPEYEDLKKIWEEDPDFS
jgi:hypothetical protein